jgi:hypothetical protein
MATSLLSLALAEAQLASLCLTTCLYGLSRKGLCLSTLADTAMSIDRRFLRIFYGYNSGGVSQRLREHSPTAQEGPSGVIRDASAGDLGTGPPFARIDIHCFNVVVLVYRHHLDPSKGCIRRWNGREYRSFLRRHVVSKQYH